MALLELSLILLTALSLAWPVGGFMAGIYSGRPQVGDRLFLLLERLCYRIIGIDASQVMSWKTYGKAFLFSNLALGASAFLLFLFQHRLPLNPDGVGSLSWDLALHTAVSFLTNTNQQHYAGQAQLSYLSQSFVIGTLQFVTPAMALALLAAVLRGMTGGLDRDTAEEGEDRNLGNYYADVIRTVVRLLLPLAFLNALILASQGVPSTFAGAETVTVLDPAATVKEQIIPVGPVAAMVSIKQLGSNGGGW